MSTKRLVAKVTLWVPAAACMWAVTLSDVAAAENVAAGPPPVTCRACVVVSDAGETLWARNARARLPNASTTKMGTALLVERRAGLDATVMVSSDAADTGGGGLDLVPGERLSVRSLLHALLLTSSNDAAVALAEHVAGSEAAFVADLNRLVRRLGARRTQFVTAHGLDVAGHFSTARDLARIGAALLREPVLARIVATRRSFVTRHGSREELVNSNSLLDGYDGAVGVKTGNTSNAGDVLVAAAERHGRRLIAVAMNSKSAAVDAGRLLDYGFERLARAVLVRRTAGVGGLIFDSVGATGAQPARAVRGLVPADTVDVLFRPGVGADLPLRRGEAVGTVVVAAAEGTVARVPAVATAPVGARRSDWVGDLAAGVIAGVLRAAAAVAGPAGAP